MIEPHCAHCGGLIRELRYISYQPAPGAAVAAPVRGDLCDCKQPVVYGPPPGYQTSPGFPIPSRENA